MPKDRLKELQKAAPSWPRISYLRVSTRDSRSHDLPHEPDEAIRLTTISIDNNEPNIAEFLSQIELIETLIQKILELSQEVKNIYAAMLKPMPDPKLSQELENKKTDIKNLSYDISSKLKKLENAQKNQDERERNSVKGRIKEMQIFSLTRQFRDAMMKYNQESLAHREKCKGLIKRELEIAGYRKTEDEIENMLDSGFPGTFATSILVDVQHAKNALQNIESRHRDIIQLEKNLRELKDMFIDLADLVVAQGAMIDSIEHNVLKAADHVGDAGRDLRQAHENKEKARKKKFWIILIVIVIVCILVSLVIGYGFLQKKLLGR